MSEGSPAKLSPADDETASLLGDHQRAATAAADQDRASLRSSSRHHHYGAHDDTHDHDEDDEDYHHDRDREERRRFLDPDDPAVSPLNLQAVKTMRFALTVLLVLTYVWAVVLFINCFVSIPFIKLRTSGFLELE